MPLFRRDPVTPKTPESDNHSSEPEPETSNSEYSETKPAPTEQPSALAVTVPQADAFAPTSLTGIFSLPIAAEDDESEDASFRYKTPIYTLFNPDSGSRITLVSNVHIGQPDYFRQLLAIILDLEAGGATIHCERVLPPTDEHLAATSDALRQLHARYWPAVEEGKGAYASAGIVDKGTIFKDEPDSWQRHDITSLEILEFLGLTAGRAWIETIGASGQLRHSGPDVVRATLRKMFNEGAIPMVRAGIHRTEWGMDDWIRFALYRELVAISAVDIHLALNPGTDLALVWGVGHMPGFRTALASRGYKPESEQWISVTDPAKLNP